MKTLEEKPWNFKSIFVSGRNVLYGSSKLIVKISCIENHARTLFVAMQMALVK